MANLTDHPFIPVTYPTWPQILTAPVLTHPAQNHLHVLDTLKIDASTVIQPFQIVTNVGQIWSNTVDTFMRVAWPAIVKILIGGGGAEKWTELGDTVPVVPFAVGDLGKVPQVVDTGGAVYKLDLLPGANFTTWVGLTDTKPVTAFTLADVGKGVRIVNDGGTAKLDLGFSGDEPSVAGILTLGSGVLDLGTLVTDVDFAAGDGEIPEKLPGGGVIYHPVSWPATTVTADTGSPANIWYVEDPGFSGTGTIQKSTSFLTPAQERVTIQLGFSVHDTTAGEVLVVASVPDIARDHGQLLNDLLAPADLLSIRTGFVSEIAATLTFDRTLTTFFGKAINGGVSFVDPNHLSVAASVGAQVFDTIADDGAIFSTAITDIPKTYNLAGVETALGGKTAAVHQIAIFPSGRVICQLGKTAYSKYDDAVAAISLEKFNNPLWIFATVFGARMANAVISAQATTLWEDGKAHLFPDFSTGGGSTGVSSFTGLTDTENAYPVGSAGFFVNVTPTEDGLLFQDPDEIVFPTHSLSFAYSDPLTLSSSPKSPIWDIDFHPSVNTTFFTYPAVGSISNNEVQVLQKGMYALSAEGTALLTSGWYMNPGLSFYLNGVEIQGTQSSTVGDDCVNIQHYSADVEVELDDDDLVTPGFYKFSGNQELIGNRTRFSIKFLRKTP